MGCVAAAHHLRIDAGDHRLTTARHWLVALAVGCMTSIAPTEPSSARMLGHESPERLLEGSAASPTFHVRRPDGASCTSSPFTNGTVQTAATSWTRGATVMIEKAICKELP